MLFPLSLCRLIEEVFLGLSRSVKARRKESFRWWSHESQNAQPPHWQALATGLATEPLAEETKEMGDGIEELNEKHRGSWSRKKAA